MGERGRWVAGHIAKGTVPAQRLVDDGVPHWTYWLYPAIIYYDNSFYLI